MTIDKKKFLNVLKFIDTASIVLVVFLAFVQPYVPIYDASGKINERGAMLSVLIVLLTIAFVVPIFRKEIKLILTNKKPYQITKKHNVVHMPRINYIVAIIFAICPIFFVPMAIFRYSGDGIRTQLFYAAFYIFVYIGIGTRLQMKIGLNNK